MKQRELETAISNVQILLADLKACTTRKDLEWGRRIHANAKDLLSDTNQYIATALIKMYTKCGSMVEAHCLFETIREPDVVSWNVLLLGHADNGNGHAALDLFMKMKSRGCAFSPVTCIAALKACISLATTGQKEKCLEKGKEIHSAVGSNMDLYVQNTLINMYAKCGAMEDARRMFDDIVQPDVVSWNVLLMGYAESGDGTAVLELFSRMKERRCLPNSVTYMAALKACTLLAVSGDGSQKNLYLKRGREIHSEIGCHLDHYVQNTLIDMYAKCGSVVDARSVFDGIGKPDVVSWNVLLLGYAENGDGHTSLELFSKMKASKCLPNSVTYIAALKACTSLAVNGEDKNDCLRQGKEIHMEIGANLDNYVKTSLIDMYSKCGDMVEARKVFENIKRPVVVSWNALLLGYADNGEGNTALGLFSKMKIRGYTPNSITYVGALKACTALAINGNKGDGLKHGREIHSEIVCKLNHYLQSTLIVLYSKCGSMKEARCVFDNIKNPVVVSWNALIIGYAENGEGLVALELFRLMKLRGYIPDSVTYVAALKACTSLVVNEDGRLECLDRGREIHLEVGSHMNRYVLSTLIDMYAKVGSMAEAACVFDSIQKPDVVSWNALLMGYADNGEGNAALELFYRMRGCTPDCITYVAVLKGCSLIGNLALGRKFHSQINEFNAHVVTSLVDFYAKCGSMVEAREVFELHPQVRCVPTWNALLAGYSSFGESDSVFDVFTTMQDRGFRPDSVTFLCMLLCCSHAGLVKQAREYFGEMLGNYGVKPTLMHYTCMVDVLGRRNQLNEAVFLLREMACDSDAVPWRSVLGACRKWKNVEIGRMAYQSINKKDSSVHLLMGHIYGSWGMWEEQRMVVSHVRKTVD